MPSTNYQLEKLRIYEFNFTETKEKGAKLSIKADIHAQTNSNKEKDRGFIRIILTMHNNKEPNDSFNVSVKALAFFKFEKPTENIDTVLQQICFPIAYDELGKKFNEISKQMGNKLFIPSYDELNE